jgi:hypothetical protein
MEEFIDGTLLGSAPLFREHRIRFAADDWISIEAEA